MEASELQIILLIMGAVFGFVLTILGTMISMNQRRILERQDKWESEIATLVAEVKLLSLADRHADREVRDLRDYLNQELGKVDARVGAVWDRVDDLNANGCHFYQTKQNIRKDS